MGRAKKHESGVTAQKEVKIHGGARVGAGRKKTRTKLKMITFKWPLQAIKEATRFARARKISRNEASHKMIEEFVTWLNDPKKLFTWGGEQVLIGQRNGNT